jgi:tRNA 2-thiouridine synthesizing protein A
MPLPMSTPRARTVTAASVVAAVDAQWGQPCGACGVELIGHDVVVGLLMGQSDAPRCTSCLARALGDDLALFRTRARSSVQRLGCYRAGWVHSDRRLARAGAWPEARWPRALRLDVDVDDDDADDTSGACATPSGSANACAPTGSGDASDPALAPSARFDAGDMGCGDLVLELRLRLQPLAPGDVLLVRATDPGAPGDLPAWCRVTHHTLVHHEHPLYWIRRRDDAPA